MENRRSFLLISLMLILAQALLAVPAVPWLVEQQQPDGTLVSVYIRGDEKVRWMESPDGYTLLYDNNRNIVYAEKDQAGDLVPTSIVYGMSSLPQAADQQLSGLQKHLRYSQAQVDAFSQIWQIGESAKTEKSSKARVTGNKKALCILMNFSDKTMGKTKTQFENLMNQVGYSAGTAKGSVKDFYKENSYGQLDLTVTVVGPYATPNTCAYYGNENRYQDFARAAVQAADADVNYNDFANSSNELETVHIIFAGHGDEAIGNGRQIWSHKWNIRPELSLDGVRISTYSCSPELRNASGNTLTAIGVICHELCHVFGADDYYDTDYGSSGGEYPNTGEWDLMSGGSWNGNGDSPAHINMFQKILYEWVQPVELTEPMSVTDMPNSAQNPVAYIVKPYTNDEQYVLENRQKIGFDSQVPGGGLLIYHVHNSAAGGRVDNSSHPQQVYVVAASSKTAIPGSRPSSYGTVDSYAALFGSAKREFSKDTTPAMFRWNGASGTTDGVKDKPITNISQNNKLISFDFMGGYAPSPCQPVRNFELEQDGNALVLKWDIPEQLDGYELEFTYSVYENEQLLVEGLTETHYELTLSAYGNYTYCIKALNAEEACESEEVCLLLEYPNPYNPVEHFTISQQGKDVLISWSLPIVDEGDKPVLYYELFRDEELVATLEPDKTDYLDERPELGVHTYSILTYYGQELVSEPRTAEIGVRHFDECKQIPEISFTLEEDLFSMNWTRHPYIVSYAIYRNDELIAENYTDTLYTEQLSSSGNYRYAIVSQGEECRSKPESIAFDFVNPCEVNRITDLQISKTWTHLILDWAIESTDTRRSQVFFDGFEDDISDWLFIDADGDRANWDLNHNAERVRSGSYSMISYSLARGAALHPDNWLISPAIPISSDNFLSFWCNQREGYEGEHYAVYLSTTDRELASFELLWEETLPESGWQERVIDLSEYDNREVYIAFRHYNCSGKFALYLDDVGVYEPMMPHYNLYENGELIAEGIVDTHYEREMTAVGTYTYGVSYVDYCETEPLEKTVEYDPVGLEEVIADAVTVYPLITDGLITIRSLPGSRVVLKDISGRTLDVYDSSGELNLRLSYSPGIYLVIVENASKTIVNKIILK